MWELLQRILRKQQKQIFRYEQQIRDKGLVADLENRDLRAEAMYSQMYQELYARGYEYAWIMEHMFTADSQYIVITDGGKLYRFDVEFVNENEIRLSEPVEVSMQFVTVGQDEDRSNVIFTRDSVTKELKFTCIAGSTVLNRIGVIDSRDLYDDIEKRFDNDAFVTYYHMGEKVKFGEVRGVFRLDNLLMAYGVIDETTLLGQYAEERLKEDGWGISIGFRSDVDPTTYRFGEVEIPVFTSGKLVEISILREADAACYFTNIRSDKDVGVNRQQAKEKLELFMGEDNEAVDKLLDEASLRERAIENENLITRDGESDVEVEAEVETVEAEEAEIVIDEGLIDEIADLVLIKSEDAQEALRTQIRTLTETVEALTKRLGAIENEGEITEADMPAYKRQIVRVGYRPTATNVQPDEDDEDDADEIELTDFRKRAKLNKERTLLKVRGEK